MSGGGAGRRHPSPGRVRHRGAPSDTLLPSHRPTGVATALVPPDGPPMTSMVIQCLSRGMAITLRSPNGLIKVMPWSPLCHPILTPYYFCSLSLSPNGHTIFCPWSLSVSFVAPHGHPVFFSVILSWSSHIIYLDLCAAIGTVPRHILITKLEISVQRVDFG